MKSYDKVFITNLPSFYKKNLYNEINKKQRVLAIFTDDGDPTRNGDFYNGNIEFDSENLGKRNSFSKVFFLLKIIFFLRIQNAHPWRMEQRIAVDLRICLSATEKRFRAGI